MLSRMLCAGALAILLGSISVMIPSEAQASVLADLSVEDRAVGATFIVEGEVQTVWTEMDEKGRIWTRARVRVDAQLKGEDLPGEIVVDSMGGRFGDYSLTVVGQAVFSEGEQLFLFLDEIQNGSRLVPLGKFLGKYTVRRAPGETRHHVLNWHPRGGTSTFDHRFIPHPTPVQRFYLDDLRQTVSETMATGWMGQEIPGLSPLQLEQRNTSVRRRLP
jgi:hypothetical protein